MPNTYFTPIEVPALPEIGEDYLPESVSVHFHFGRHESGSDFDEAAELLDSHDIFVPEYADWRPEGLNWLRNVSRSGYSGFQKLLKNRASPIKRNDESDYDFRLAKALQGKHKTVLLVDAPRGMGLGLSRNRDFGYGSFDDEIEAIYEQQVAVVEGGLKRDSIIVENLGVFVTQAVTEHPKLREKPEVPVLVTLGANHDRIFEHLSASPYMTDRVTSSYQKELEKDEVGNLAERIHRAIMDNKPVDRAELISLYIGNYIEVPLLGHERVREEQRQIPLEITNQLLAALTQDIDRGAGELIYRALTRKSTVEDKEKIAAYAEQAGLVL